MSSPTPTPAAATPAAADNSGPMGHWLTFLAVAGGMLIALSKTSTAKDMVPAVSWLVVLLVLLGVLKSFIKDKNISRAITWLVVLVVAPTVIPYAQATVTKVFYGTLGTHTATALKDRMVDNDVRAADSIAPIGTGSRIVLGATRKQLDYRTAAELSQEIKAALDKSCWGWDNVNKKSLPPQPCTATQLHEQVQQIVQARQADLNRINEIRLPGEPAAAPSQPEAKSYWSKTWSNIHFDLDTIWLVAVASGVIGLALYMTGRSKP